MNNKEGYNQEDEGFTLFGKRLSTFNINDIMNEIFPPEDNHKKYERDHDTGIDNEIRTTEKLNNYIGKSIYHLG